MSSTKYPIEVCCVVADHSDIDTDIEIVNEHTCNLGLKFKLREYDSWKYSDDRDMVASLPAFHIYIGEGYVDTFHTNENVLNNIDECIKKYEAKMLAAKRMTKFWKNFICAFWKQKAI